MKNRDGVVRLFSRVMSFALALALGSANAELAGDVSAGRVVLGEGRNDSLVVPLFKSRVLRLSEPAARVSVGNPDIADILIVRASQLYVLGKDLGTTNVHLWDRSDELIGTVSVEVAPDLEALKYKLYQMFPGEDIKVFAVQRSIALQGTVSSVSVMTAALQLARAYLAQIQTSQKAVEFKQQDQSQREDQSVGEVINLLMVGGGQTVMLEVKVAEIARTELKRMNARFNAINARSGEWKWGGVNGGATFPDALFGSEALRRSVPGGDGGPLSGLAPLSPAIDEFMPNAATIADQGMFASFLSNNTLFNLVLDVAKEKGLAKILAEPTLTTLAGQEAKFLSGGEFPIPVPRGDDGVTIVFKEFGVGLNFLPMVVAPGVINVKLNISVSELVNSNSIGITSDDATSTFLVPALSKRSASVTVELREGQTMGIAGLINENLREVVTKFPGLGDLPVLGALFRSQEFINDETELVILVTPRIAKPIDPKDIRLPTDKFVEPNDVDFYLMGRLEGRSKQKELQAPKTGGTEATYGHQVE